MISWTESSKIIIILPCLPALIIVPLMVSALIDSHLLMDTALILLVVIMAVTEAMGVMAATTVMVAMEAMGAIMVATVAITTLVQDLDMGHHSIAEAIPVMAPLLVVMVSIPAIITTAQDLDIPLMEGITIALLGMAMAINLLIAVGGDRQILILRPSISENIA